MKRTLIFLLVLASNPANYSYACGFYPYSEEIRFSVLMPYNFNFHQYSPFYYSSDNFFSLDDHVLNDKGEVNSFSGVKLNLDLWLKRCHNVPSLKDAYEAVYVMGKTDRSNNHSTNTFLNYLIRNNDDEAINYLNFAKLCSKYNTDISDPWERNRDVIAPQRDQLIKTALKRIKKLNDDDLADRYAFIAIRLAYYNGDDKTIKSIYQKYFSNKTNKNIIDYWSMYFINSGA